jgi:hypothetical protein
MKIEHPKFGFGKVTAIEMKEPTEKPIYILIILVIKLYYLALQNFG